MSALARILVLVRGDPEADRAVPPSGTTAHLTLLGTAAMAFLAVFALAFALAAGRVASDWSGALDGAATVEIPALDEVQTEVLATRTLEVLSATPGIVSARRLEPEDIAQLLEPWTSEATALDGLPFPVLIAVEEASDLDRDSLLLRLEGEVPGVRYDRHESWRDRMLAAAGRLRVLGLIAVILAAGTMFVVVSLAVRASLAVNSGVIETLRLLGARDTYIARAFVRRFTLRGLTGALIGTFLGAAALLLLPMGAGESLAALRPASVSGWALMCLIPILAGAMAFAATRRAAFRTLYRLT